MKLLIVICALMMAGCQTALVYTGEVRGPVSSVQEVDRSLGDFYRSRGFAPAPAINGAGYAPGEWHLARGKYLVVWLGQTLKEEKIEIRIVPQPGANEAAREIAEAIRAFMASHFPTTSFELVEKPELDIFR